MKTTIPPSERYNQRLNRHQMTTALAEQVLLEVMPHINEPQVSLLDGGFSNQNFKIQSSDQNLLLRIFHESNEVPFREQAIIKLASEHGVCAPKIIKHAFKADSVVAAIYEYIPGNTLDQLLLEEHPKLEQVFALAGEQLAKIHQIQFAHAGLIDASGSVIYKFEQFCKEALRFITTPLEKRAGDRLGAGLSQALKELVSQHWHLVEQTYQHPCLIHCDFNPKNIVVSPDQKKVSIIDWEFAIAGGALNDLGNFFRFEEDYSQLQINHFIQAYKSAGGVLTEHWREASMLLDIVSMCTFLDRVEEMEKTFRTAKKIIQRTISNPLFN